MFSIAPEVFRNPLPSKIGTIGSSSMSIKIKYVGMLVFPILMRISVNSQIGLEVAWLTSFIRVRVCLNTTYPNFSHSARDIKLTLDLLSHTALSISILRSRKVSIYFQDPLIFFSSNFKLSRLSKYFVSLSLLSKISLFGNMDEGHDYYRILFFKCNLILQKNVRKNKWLQVQAQN
jgi:hypothetical protein